MPYGRYKGKRVVNVDWDEVRKRVRAQIPKLEEYLRTIQGISFKVCDPSPISGICFARIRMWIPHSGNRKQALDPLRIAEPSDLEVQHLGSIAADISREIPGFRCSLKNDESGRGLFCYTFGPIELPQKVGV